MNIPPSYSRTAKQWLLLLLNVRKAATSLANTTVVHGDRMSVSTSEFKLLIEAIAQLEDFENTDPG